MHFCLGLRYSKYYLSFSIFINRNFSLRIHAADTISLHFSDNMSYPCMSYHFSDNMSYPCKYIFYRIARFEICSYVKGGGSSY